MANEPIDRSHIKLTPLDEAGADDIDYWMSRSPNERIQALEYLRRWVYGDAAVDAPVQRILETAQLGKD